MLSPKSTRIRLELAVFSFLVSNNHKFDKTSYFRQMNQGIEEIAWRTNLSVLEMDLQPQNKHELFIWILATETSYLTELYWNKIN
jgi:hypothetical protein